VAGLVAPFKPELYRNNLVASHSIIDDSNTLLALCFTDFRLAFLNQLTLYLNNQCSIKHSDVMYLTAWGYKNAVKATHLFIYIVT